MSYEPERQMDVPTDTKMPERCTAAPQKDPKMGVYTCPQDPMTYREQRTYRCTGGMGHTDYGGMNVQGHIDIQEGIWMPPKLTTPCLSLI